MDWVGGADTAPLRVKTDLAVEINGVPFAAGTSYSLDFESDPKPVEVCVTLDNTDPAGGTVRQCDLTRSIGSYKGKESFPFFDSVLSHRLFVKSIVYLSS